MLDWSYVEELIRSGYKPYVRRKKQGTYMSLKKGRDEVGLGVYDENAWNRMLGLYVIFRQGSEKVVEEKQPIDKQKPAISVSREVQGRLNDFEKARASVARRGKLMHATCYYARDGKCTEPHVIESLGKSGANEVDVNEYICNSCLCYRRFQ